MTDLNAHQQERFDRNIRLAQVGPEGQRRLLQSTAVVVGAGGLGSAAIYYLAAAGVGRLRIVESERLEPSNLNRQILYAAADVGRLKAESARRRVAEFWPQCAVATLAERLSADTARRIVRGADVVLDCTDNFAARFALADACWLEGRPLVSAAVLRMEGQLLTIDPAAGSPCYRCLIPEPPGEGAVPGAAQVGILGSVAGTFGALQATEAVKVLLGIGQTLAHRMLIYDGVSATFRTVGRRRDPQCRFCCAVRRADEQGG